MSVEKATGERVGPYLLLETLGGGGMGVVHRAVDDAGREVALKLVRPEFAEDTTFRRRLAREVDTMRRVRSPYVAEVLDADVTAECPYIVTRFIDGHPLDGVVRAAGPLSGGPLARVATGLAEAVTAIHEADVVHRDLKPSNIMMVDGAPVVIDFGIAHAVDATRLTQTGMVVGTPGYLGPEIIDGRPPGPAVDVYAWAATVAFAATGRAPFGKGSLEAVLARILSGNPDLDGVPAALEPVLRACLARDPEARPPAADLADLVRAADLGAPPPIAPTVRQPAVASPARAGVRSGPAPAPQGGATADRVPAAPAPGPEQAPRVALGWYKLLGHLAIVAAVAVCAVAPVLGVACVVAAVWYLWAGDSAMRSRRVPARSVRDLVLVPFRVPGSLGRSIGALVPALLYSALAAAACALIVWTVVRHHAGAPAAVGRWSAAAFAWASLAAPGVRAPRRQLVRLLSAVARTRPSTVSAGLLLAWFTVLAVTAAWALSPHWWPIGDPAAGSNGLLGHLRDWGGALLHRR